MSCELLRFRLPSKPTAKSKDSYKFIDSNFFTSRKKIHLLRTPFLGRRCWETTRTATSTMSYTQNFGSAIDPQYTSQALLDVFRGRPDRRC